MSSGRKFNVSRSSPLQPFYIKYTEKNLSGCWSTHVPKNTATKSKKEKTKNGYKCILWSSKQGDFDAATLIWISNRWPGCICLTFGVLAAIRIARHAASEKHAVGMIPISISRDSDCATPHWICKNSSNVSTECFIKKKKKKQVALLHRCWIQEVLSDPRSL